MTEPAEREFRVMARGAVRDLILEYFAYGLRNRTNPETGVAFTEDEIARAIAPGSRWYRQAQADDDYCQGEQRRALWLADQIRVGKASTEWLDEYHGRLWDPDGRLPATGGAGYVTVTAPVGTTIIGSTTVPDEGAYWGRSPDGARFQVFQSAVIGAGGTSPVLMVGMDTGEDTNLEAGKEITWAYRHPNMAPTAVVVDDFTGGTEVETDAERAARIEGEIRYKQGGGNPPQQRSWARKASNAIEDAFVYPTALHSGSVVIAITQKRLGTAGPSARLPNLAVMQAAIARMVAPNSPVNSALPVCLVVPWQAQSVDMALHLALPTGSAYGFKDSSVFPSHDSSTTQLPRVTSIGSSTITFAAPDDTTLPGQSAGATVTDLEQIPSMLWWDRSTSQWVKLSVTQIEDLGGSSFRVTIAGIMPSWVESGTAVCPEFSLSGIVSETLVAYFDERGPGELVSSSDVRWQRCQRHPEPSEERPARVGAEIATRVIEALGGVSVDATADWISRVAPDVPSDLTAGPNMLVLGQVGVYPR